MIIRPLAISILITSALLGGANHDVNLPPPYATPSIYTFPKIIPRPEGASLHVPPGFHVELFADGFQCPRFMALGSAVEILVSDSVRAVTPSRTILDPESKMNQHPTAGSVYVLTGSQQRKKLIDNLDLPYGLAFWKDYLYVAETESVKRYRYSKYTLTVGPGQEVLSLKGLRDFHWTRTLLFDRSGVKIYIAIGSASNHTIGEDTRRATICRFNPDGSGFEIFAAGLRNPVGLQWYPSTDTLWASVQERDELGDDLVPDFFTHIEPNGFYGWPYAYIGPHEDPFNSGFQLIKHMLRHPQALQQASKVSSLVAATITPDVLLGAHVAPLDFIFYTGQQFPSEYRGGAFLAFHGSSNRSKRVGYSIAFVPFKDGRPSGPAQEFMSGWMLSPDRNEVWGRPVGLLQLSDGSLLISDDAGRKIWRVSYHPPESPKHAAKH